MKILHIIDSGGLYGAEVMLLTLMEEQRRMGLMPILASIGCPGEDEKQLEVEARRRGLRVEPFRMRPGPNIAGAFRVLRYAWREGVDLLHSHGYKGNILFGLLPRTVRRLPMVATLHGWTWTGGWSRMGLYEWLDRMSLRCIERVVAVNEPMRKKIRLRHLEVISNGIPLNRPDATGKDDENGFRIDPVIAEFCGRGFTVGAIGRLSSEKGYDVLLEAAKELSNNLYDVGVVILGEGIERHALSHKIHELGLENRVLMPGYVRDAGAWMHLFDVFVLPSLTEGLPMVILEAMAAGVPIVATRVGGVPEMLKNGEAGVLVPANSARELAEGILRIMDGGQMVKAMTTAAAGWLADKYSSRAMAANYVRVYADLKSGNRSSKTSGARDLA